jgi:hypothetical protein
VSYTKPMVLLRALLALEPNEFVWAAVRSIVGVSAAPNRGDILLRDYALAHLADWPEPWGGWARNLDYWTRAGAARWRAQERPRDDDRGPRRNDLDLRTWATNLLWEPAQEANAGIHDGRSVMGDLGAAWASACRQINQRLGHDTLAVRELVEPDSQGRWGDFDSASGVGVHGGMDFGRTVILEVTGASGLWVETSTRGTVGRGAVAPSGRGRGRGRGRGHQDQTILLEVVTALGRQRLHYNRGRVLHDYAWPPLDRFVIGREFGGLDLYSTVARRATRLTLEEIVEGSDNLVPDHILIEEARPVWELVE